MDPTDYLQKNCNKQDCKSCELMEKYPTLPHHHKCSFEQRRSDFQNGYIWRHFLFVWRRHDPNPFTGDEWEIELFWTCDDYYGNKSRMNKLDNIGYKIYEEIVTPAIPSLMPLFDDPRILYRYVKFTRVTNGDITPKNYGYWNRLVLKKLLPQSLHPFINKKRKLSDEKYLAEIENRFPKGIFIMKKRIEPLELKRMANVNKYYIARELKKIISINDDNIFNNLFSEYPPHNDNKLNKIEIKQTQCA